MLFHRQEKSEVMAESEKRRAEVGEEVDEASDSAAEKESSGSPDNIDNESVPPEGDRRLIPSV